MMSTDDVVIVLSRTDAMHVAHTLENVGSGGTGWDKHSRAIAEIFRAALSTLPPPTKEPQT